MVIPCGWKIPDAVAATREFLGQAPPRRAAIHDLMAELISEGLFARRCAADLARRVSAREPGILRKYVPLLLDILAELPEEQWQARGYLLVALSLNAATGADCRQLASLLRPLSKEPRIAPRAMALEAFANLAIAEPSLREEVLILLERARHDRSCAMQSRARRMLPLLLAAELKTSASRRPGNISESRLRPQKHQKKQQERKQ